MGGEENRKWLTFCCFGLVQKRVEMKQECEWPCTKGTKGLGSWRVGWKKGSCCQDRCSLETGPGVQETKTLEVGQLQCGHSPHPPPVMAVPEVGRKMVIQLVQMVAECPRSSSRGQDMGTTRRVKKWKSRQHEGKGRNFPRPEKLGGCPSSSVKSTGKCELPF
jgi:hypothetical protein